MLSERVAAVHDELVRRRTPPNHTQRIIVDHCVVRERHWLTRRQIAEPVWQECDTWSLARQAHWSIYKPVYLVSLYGAGKLYFDPILPIHGPGTTPLSHVPYRTPQRSLAPLDEYLAYNILDVCWQLERLGAIYLSLAKLIDPSL